MRATPTLVTNGRAIHSTDWQIIDTPPIPGVCSTDLRARVMRAPSDPGDLEQAIRGHEMIHAGWSPAYTAQELGQVLDLDPDAIASVEEWRVNAIAYKAGVDVSILHDPGDVATAEKLARSRQLAPALRLVVQTHGTNAHRRVLKTLRKFGPVEWRKPIANVQNAIRQARRDHVLEDRRNFEATGYVLRTPDGDWERLTINVPAGFRATVQLARVLDHWKENDPTPTRQEEQDNAKRRAESEQRRAQHRRESDHVRKFREHPEHNLEGTDYQTVRLAHLDHDLEHKGKATRRRIASDTGKNPRRVSRWIDDPARRVFDRKIRARGGVVLIDQSGSMSLNRHDIDRLLEQAGGAIVIGYSDIGEDVANVWVHAQNGRRSSSTPTGGSQNAVDGSALMYALSRRENRRDPVLWVTDGRCYDDSGALPPATCAILENVVRRNNVTMLDDIDEAIAELARLARGNNARTRVNPLIQKYADAYRTGE